MKKTSIILAAFSVIFLFSAFTKRIQNAGFTGVILYGININSDADPQIAQTLQGSTIKVYVRGDMSRTESNFGGMYRQIVIADSKNPEQPIVLMEIMGNKYQVKIDDKAKKAADAAKPDIKYIEGSSKTIAGYVCKEAQAVVTDRRTGNKYTSDIYYTDKLPNIGGIENGRYRGLTGIPLSFSSNRNGTSFTMIAQSVTKQPVPDSLFVTPSGYKLMSQEEIKQDMTQKMGGGQ